MFNLRNLLLPSRTQLIFGLPALIAVVFLPLATMAQASLGPCACTNCPQFMPDGFTGQFFIQIQNAENPTLGQNGQGVCGVKLNFDHEYLGDLQIILTSPAGQSVTLVGPIGFWGPTDFTTWNVAFVPCGDAANPDPGFSDTWNNNQAWGLFGDYFGSYYPNQGCLENFNAGPVNGQWTLTVIDGQAVDVGNFYNYEIIFCDLSGISCFSCAANAGNLLQSDVVACQGASSLDLNLPPTYTPPNAAPSLSDYGYTYVIGGAGGVIQGYDPEADLSAYPPGNYTVCGMSYLLSNEGDIPPPNGSLTITQLSSQLNSTTPPFCAKITSNCVNVLIKPLPPDEEENQEICAPQCYVFHNQTYCQSGTYVRNLNLNGCPYTATLYLTVLQPSYRTIIETVCPGECSTTPGFENACTAGQYIEKFVNEAGCDSTVTLNLSVMNIVANIAPPPQLTCSQSTAQLQGTGSTLGPGVTYLWTASNGGALSGPTNGINATATAAGDYQLRVCKTAAGVSCCDSASVTVTGSQTLPAAPASINGATPLCPGQTATFSIAPVANASSYTWTVPPGVVINSGQGTTSLSVTWNNTSGNICVAAVNACGASTPTCLAVAISTAPVPAQPQGAAIVCVGGTENYSIPAVSGATNYTWTVAAPATIASGQGTPNIVVNWGNSMSGNICVNISSNCGTSQDVCLPVQINDAPAQPNIAGDSTLCDGASGSYSIASVSGATSYTWTVPASGSIVSGQNTTALDVAWAGAPGGNVCVTAANSCGAGPQDCFPVVVQTVPTANAGMDGAVCGTNFNLQATASVSGSSGAWTTVSGSGTASFSNANAAATDVDVSLNGAYIFQWTETNGGCSDSDSVAVNFNDSPVAGLIDHVCDGTNQNYTASFPVSGGAAPYSIPGGVISNGSFTSAPILSGQNYSFVITDANGCTSSAIMGAFNCFCATNAGQMSLQPLTTCEGGNISAQHLGGQSLDSNDITAYILHTNSGTGLGTIFGQNSTGVFSFQNGMAYGTTYYVSFIAGNNLNNQPDLADPCLSVSQGQPVIFFQNPVANAGMDADTCGLALTLNGNPTTGAGQWTVNGNGLVLSDPQNAVTAATATASGIFTITWMVTENGCTNSDEVVVQFHESPTLSDLQRNCDAANENFTVTLTLSGGTAPYQVNNTAATGNTFTSSPFSNGQSYSFTVTDANGCTMPPVTGSYSCNCATNAGTLQTDTLTACEGTTVTVAANAIAPSLDANDVTAYILHDGAGPALGQVFEQNTTGVFGFQNGMNYGQTYFVSLAAGNDLNGLPNPADPCFSVAAGQPVVFLKNPVPDAGLDASTCTQTIDLQAVGSSFSGSWSQISGPGAAVFIANNNPTSTVNMPVPGIYIFQWTETNSICTASDDVSIIFFESPSVTAVEEACNGANTQFTVTFTASGGTAPYTATGLTGSFSGGSFISAPLANNTNYSFVITDANGCSSPSVSGVKNCNCATDAGSMQTSLTYFCENSPATAVWSNDATLDSDDLLQFILHDQSGTSVGNILAKNAQPAFDLVAPLQTGVTYYISAIAGNNLAGSVDLNDPCLSVTPGSPVQWKPMPIASLIGDAVICNGESTILTFEGIGVFPLSLTYTDGAGAQNTLTINSQQSVTVPVSPTTTSVFTLVAVSDGTLPTCSTQLNETATVTVNQPVFAGTPNEPVELCEGTALPLQLVNFLNNADFGGQWTETSAAPSLPGSFNAATGTFVTTGQPAGTYTFQYAVAALPPCPGDKTTVTVKLLALPIADAGEDQAINCGQTAVLLGSVDSGNAPNVIYEWLLNGDTVGNTEQVFVSTAGEYTLVASNAAGCSASDAVTVVLDNDPPQANIISVNNIRCFGEKNGSIAIDSVTAKHPPLLYALNSGPLSANPVFTGLGTGIYTLTLQDANGCEWTSQPIVVGEPPELLIELGADVEAALGDSVYLKALTSVPVTALDTIMWQPLLDSTAAGQDHQQFFLLQSWKVNVTVTDSNGCVARDEILVRVDRRRNVFVPNVFNPASTQNSVLQVYGGQDVALVEVFRIYDRWGEQVFESLDFHPNNPDHGWAGKQRGKEAAPGVYAYYVVVRFVDGEQEIFTGDVTVYR